MKKFRNIGVLFCILVVILTVVYAQNETKTPEQDFTKAGDKNCVSSPCKIPPSDIPFTGTATVDDSGNIIKLDGDLAGPANLGGMMVSGNGIVFDGSTLACGTCEVEGISVAGAEGMTVTNGVLSGSCGASCDVEGITMAAGTEFEYSEGKLKIKSGEADVPEGFVGEIEVTGQSKVNIGGYTVTSGMVTVNEDSTFVLAPNTQIFGPDNNIALTVSEETIFIPADNAATCGSGNCVKLGTTTTLQGKGIEFSANYPASGIESFDINNDPDPTGEIVIIQIMGKDVVTITTSINSIDINPPGAMPFMEINHLQSGYVIGPDGGCYDCRPGANIGAAGNVITGATIEGCEYVGKMDGKTIFTIKGKKVYVHEILNMDEFEKKLANAKVDINFLADTVALEKAKEEDLAYTTAKIELAGMYKACAGKGPTCSDKVYAYETSAIYQSIVKKGTVAKQTITKYEQMKNTANSVGIYLEQLGKGGNYGADGVPPGSTAKKAVTPGVDCSVEKMKTGSGSLNADLC